MPLIPIVLNWIKPLNESREEIAMYITDYKILDENKHFHLIFFHSYIYTLFATVLFLNTELLFMFCTQHASAILAAIG